MITCQKEQRHAEEQCERHLPGIARGEIWWCQGFSEPGAGSDLPSLSSRAELDGDRFRVNGQKVWTSHGHRADWILALVRTHPGAAKRAGISCLLIDLATPGVSTRPMVLISRLSFPSYPSSTQISPCRRNAARPIL